jgi:putative FmdB family regulatory protein
MPTYVFKCQMCGAEFEHVMKMSELDKKAADCPQCEAPTHTRVLQAVPHVGPKYKGLAGGSTDGLPGGN